MPQLQHAKPTIRNNTVQNTARLKNHLKYFHSAFLWPENQLLLQFAFSKIAKHMV